MRIGNRASAALAIGAFAGFATPAAGRTLIDTAAPGDAATMICTADFTTRGFAVYVATYEDAVVGRIRARINAVDQDGDGRADPTWDANLDGVLSPDEPAAGDVIVIDLGPTPEDLTVLDGQALRSLPESIAYLSPSHVPLLLAPGGGPPPLVDSGPVSIPLAGDHVYAVGFAFSHAGCASWSVDLEEPPPPMTVPPPAPGATMTTIGRFGLLGILGGDASSDFHGITSAQTGPATFSFVLEEANAAPTPIGDPQFGGATPGDRDGDGVADRRDDCPDLYDPDQADTCEAPAGCDASHGGGGLAPPAGVIALVAVRRRIRRGGVRGRAS